MLPVALLSLVPLALAGPSLASRSLTVRVEGAAVRGSTTACLFSIRARVVGGGRQTTCLTRIDGYPAPHAVIRSRGRMTFALLRGTVRARVRVVQRFGADGKHARQSLTGTLAGGSRRYAGARGTIRGGGTLVDTRSGLRSLHLTYRLALG